MHVDVEPVNTRLEISLSNYTFCYGRMDKITRAAMKEVEDALKAAVEKEFEGNVIDTGANRSSMMSLSQYRIYCEEFGVVAQLDKSRSKSIRGLTEKATSLGSTKLPIPFKDLGVFIDIEFQIMKDDVPSLLSLSDLK